jgi:hypothetical protein
MQTVSSVWVVWGYFAHEKSGHFTVDVVLKSDRIITVGISGDVGFFIRLRNVAIVG